MPDFLDALNHFRASVKPLDADALRVGKALHAEFDRLFGPGAKPEIVTESPPCVAHAVPLAGGNPQCPVAPVRYVTREELERMFDRGSRT